MDIDESDDVVLLEAAVGVLVFSDEIDEETIEATTDSVVLHEVGLDTVEAIEALEAVEVDVIDLDDDDVDVVSFVIIFDSSIAFTFSMTLVTSFEAEAEDDNECDLKAEEKDKALRIGRLPNAVNDLDPVNDECKVGSTVAVSTFSSLIKITLSLLDFLIFSGELGELAPLLGETLSSEDTVLGTWCSTLISYVAMVLTAVLNLGEGKEILLAKFCMKCGFLIVLILAKKFPALRFNFALWVEAALPPPAPPPEAAEAASPWTFSEITVLKADVLVST